MACADLHTLTTHYSMCSNEHYVVRIAPGDLRFFDTYGNIPDNLLYVVQMLEDVLDDS